MEEAEEAEREKSKGVVNDKGSHGQQGNKAPLLGSSTTIDNVLFYVRATGQISAGYLLVKTLVFDTFYAQLCFQCR